MIREFSNHERSEFGQNALAYEELKRKLGDTFWKGEDISISAPVVVPQHSIAEIPVLIPLAAVPIDTIAQKRMLRYLTPSTRSRFAQLGLSLADETRVILPREIKEVNQNGSGDNEAGRFESKALVANYAARPIYVPEKSRLFRLYSWMGERVKAAALRDAMAARKIEIEGEQGKDWEWEYRDDRSQAESNIIGVRVRIKPERHWIPPADDPITVDNNSRTYRKEIDALLEPVPRTEGPILWIGETPKITFGKEFDALLDRSTFRDRTQWKNYKNGYHTQSLLMDSDVSHPVRVEVYSPTIPEAMPNFVSFTFIKHNRPE